MANKENSSKNRVTASKKKGGKPVESSDIPEGCIPFEVFVKELRESVKQHYKNPKKQSKEYTVIIEKDPKSGWYTGNCKEVPGAISQGETLDELLENMKDAIALVVEWQNEKLAEFYKGHKIFYRKVKI